MAISAVPSASSASRVTVSGRSGMFCSLERLQQPSLQVMSLRAMVNDLPFSRRRSRVSLGVLYSTIFALPSGVSMRLFFFGARCLKSRYASNS